MEPILNHHVSIFSIPYELLSFIIHPSKYSLINEEMRQFKNEEITISLKKKLGKTTLNTLFITDDTKIYLSQYLDKKEIIMLAKIFVKNININTNPIITYMIGPDHVHPNFKLTNLKNSILDPSIELIVNYEENWDDTINDEQLHFELFFIFICIQNIQLNLNIKKINFNRFKKSFNVILLGLKQNIIKTLNLERTHVYFYEVEHIAAALKENTTLTSLSLTSFLSCQHDITIIAKALIGKITIKYLSLNNNHIKLEGTNAIVDALRENTTIIYLSLDDNQIDDQPATAIATLLRENTTIKTLSLTCNYIGDTGAIAIANALRENTTLTSLSLRYNKIGDVGGLAIAEALKINITLRELFLFHNNFSDAGKIKIINALTENTTLTIHIDKWKNNL